MSGHRMASLYARLLTEGKRNGTGGGLSAVLRLTSRDGIPVLSDCI